MYLVNEQFPGTRRALVVGHGDIRVYQSDALLDKLPLYYSALFI